MDEGEIFDLIFGESSGFPLEFEVWHSYHARCTPAGGAPSHGN
jgi:hypothetical protein